MQPYTNLKTTQENAHGVKNISFRVQNKFGQWSPWVHNESTTIKFRLPGNFIGIEYYSTDVLGNKEETKYEELSGSPPGIP